MLRCSGSRGFEPQEIKRLLPTRMIVIRLIFFIFSLGLDWFAISLEEVFSNSLPLFLNFFMNDDLPDEEPPKEPWQFPQTRWSLVLNAQGEDEGESAQALGELCKIYWYPLYAFVRRRGLSPEDSEDVTQGFFYELIAKNRVRLFSGEKGKLRAYLLGAIKNFVNDRAKLDRAEKRGGGEKVLSLDFEMGSAEERYTLEPPEYDTPEKLFEMRWTMAVLERVFERLEAEFRKKGNEALFQELKGAVGGESDIPFSEIGARLNMKEGAVRVALFRIRKRYRRILEDEIANTLAEGESVDEEIDYLTKVFER